MSFNYGSDEVVDGGGSFKNPEIGDHPARLRSIIHCGLFREEYRGELKKPAPEVVAVFELKDEDDFEDDGETPLTIHKSFPLKKGDKAFMTKFIAALDPKGKAKGFDDLIGVACTVNAKGSKVLDDDDNPKYINFGGISGMPTKFAKMTDALVGGGVGHVPFDAITKEAILELNPVLEVGNIICKGERYEGSVAQGIIEEMRVENPDFAKPSKKKDKDKEPDPEARPEVQTELADDEVF